MNFIKRICKNNIIKFIFNSESQCSIVVMQYKNTKSLLYNSKMTETSTFKIKPFAVNVLISSSILTWLGFTKDDEEKESELIMTIKRAILLMQRKEYPKAEQMLHLALKLAQEQQNSQGVLYVYDIMANLALDRGELNKANKLFVIVLQNLLSNGMKQDDNKVIHISLKLARICEMKGELDNAEVGYKWCLDSLQKKLNNDDDSTALLGVVQDWYAQYLLQKGQYQESLKYLKQAHKICTEIEGENSEKSVLLLNDLGTTSWKMGDLTTAENYLTKAIRFGKKLDDFQYLGVIYANLGLVCIEKGILNEAQKYCKEGWRLGKKEKNDEIVEHANFCFEQIKTHT